MVATRACAGSFVLVRLQRAEFKVLVHSQCGGDEAAGVARVQFGPMRKEFRMVSITVWLCRRHGVLGCEAVFARVWPYTCAGSCT